MVLLDRRSGDAGGPDPVAAHDDGALFSRFVQIDRLEGERILRPELEDIPHLDDALDAQIGLTAGTPVPASRVMDVGPSWLEMGPRHDPTQVKAVLVGPDDVSTGAQRLIGDR